MVAVAEGGVGVRRTTVEVGDRVQSAMRTAETIRRLERSCATPTAWVASGPPLRQATAEAPPSSAVPAVIGQPHQAIGETRKTKLGSGTLAARVLTGRLHKTIAVAQPIGPQMAIGQPQEAIVWTRLHSTKVTAQVVI
eukprot:m.37437 g.37437  ORF g.37437 m.37437 type:complete len:138 (+) comp13090_c0_seq1:247-660(+)